MDKSKRCPTCGETKPASEWHLNRQNKSGLATYCKVCVSTLQRAWYIENRERHIANVSAHYWANADVILKRGRDARRAARRKKLIDAYPEADTRSPICAVDGCERPTALGSWTAVGQWCAMHHARWYRHGDPLKVVGVAGSDRGKPCKVPGCERVSNHRGWCGMHHQRILRTGLAGVAKSRFLTGDEQCLTPGCTSPEACSGYCVSHYSRNVSGPKRRSLMKDAQSIAFTPEQLAQRMAYWGGKCWVCSGPFEAIDHVKPLSRGGAHMLANFRPICTECNSRKGAKWPYAPLRSTA